MRWSYLRPAKPHDDLPSPWSATAVTASPRCRSVVTLPSPLKARVERAVRVVADEGEAFRRRSEGAEPATTILPALDRDRVRLSRRPPDVGRHLAVAGESRVEGAVAFWRASAKSSEPLSCHAMVAYALAPLVVGADRDRCLGFLRAGGERCDLAGAPRVAAERRQVRFDVLPAGGEATQSIGPPGGEFGESAGCRGEAPPEPLTDLVAEVSAVGIADGELPSA